MNEFYLMDNHNKYNVLEYKNKLYEVFVNFGERAYKTRLNKEEVKKAIQILNKN